MAFSFEQGKKLHMVSGGCARVGYIVLGMISNNTYLIDDGEGGTIVVDPSTHPDTILEAAGGNVSALLVTHGHFDHVGALGDLRARTGAPVFASVIDTPLVEHPQAGWHGIKVDACPVDHQLQDGDETVIGRLVLKLLLTPGHTPGSAGYLIEPSGGTEASGAPMLFSGDTLFCNSVGRTDFEGGSMGDMRASMRKLSHLSDDTIVLPGHNELTTIGTERLRVIEALMHG
jgi:hydroxyacylglutathione hydrolase